MINKLYSIPVIIRFAVVGGSGLVIRTGGMYLFVDIAGFDYMVAFAILFGVVLFWNYILNSLWTFPDKERGINGFLKYCCVGLLSQAVSQAALYIFTDLAGVWYIASTIIAVFVGFVINFIISKNWVWKNDKRVVNEN